MITTNNVAGVAQNIVTVPANHIIVQQLGQQPVHTTKFITTALNVNNINNGQQITLVNSVQATNVATEPGQVRRVT